MKYKNNQNNLNASIPASSEEVSHRPDVTLAPDDILAERHDVSGTDSNAENRPSESEQATILGELLTEIDKNWKQTQEKESVAEELAETIFGGKEEAKAVHSAPELHSEQQSEAERLLAQALAEVANPESAVQEAELEKIGSGDADAHTAEPAAQTAEDPLPSVRYETVAKAVESARKESTGRFTRDAVNDETLLQELHTLLGDGTRTYLPQKNAASNGSAHPESPSTPPQSPPRIPKISAEDLHDLPDNLDDIQEDDSIGVSGRVKGAFLLLMSVLISGMIFYAVATDVLGKVF